MTTFDEQWSGQKAAMIGFLTGRGKDSVEIAQELNDGTTPANVRDVWRRWGLNNGGRSVVEYPVPVEQSYRRKLASAAKSLNIEPNEYIRRILICSLEDDLYLAVTDGKFD